MTPLISDLVMDFPPTKTMVSIPMMIRLKYSAGPNFRLNWARGTATKISPKVPRIPPMKEPIAAIPRAAPARPWRAIW